MHVHDLCWCWFKKTNFYMFINIFALFASTPQDLYASTVLQHLHHRCSVPCSTETLVLAKMLLPMDLHLLPTMKYVLSLLCSFNIDFFLQCTSDLLLSL